MYKTIRHGENSLQYTILPQHDDYSKGGGGGGAGGGGQQALMPDPSLLGHQQQQHHGVKIVHNKRRSWMAYVGLFFVCSIITGAILVPLLVSVEVLSRPKDWFYRHTAAGHSSSSRQLAGSAKTATNVAAVSSAYRHAMVARVNQTETTPPTPPPMVIPIGDDFIDQPKAIDENPPQPDISAFGVDFLATNLSNSYSDDSGQVPTDDKPATSIQTPATTSSRPTTESPMPETTRITTKLAPSMAIATPNPGRKLRKKYRQKTLTETTSPVIMMPTIQPAAAASVVVPAVAAVANATATTKPNWIDSHWPIVDTSTYFKWTVSIVHCFYCCLLVPIKQTSNELLMMGFESLVPMYDLICHSHPYLSYEYTIQFDFLFRF